MPACASRRLASGLHDGELGEAAVQSVHRRIIRIRANSLQLSDRRTLTN
jgi:hypothetical protein